MAYYEYLHIKDCWFKTGIIPTLDTRVEVDNAGFNSNWVGGTYTDAFPGLVGSNDSDWNNTTFCIKGSQYAQYWNVRVGNKEYTSTGAPITLGNRSNVSLDKNYFTVDGTQISINATSFTTSHSDLWVGTCNLNGTDFRCGDVFVGNIRIYQGGVLVLEWIPTLYNGEYTYYDTVSQTYATKYGTGTIVPGPSLEVFEADKYEVDFGHAGGTDTITVTADNSWSCTTPTGFSLSPTSGSPGETTVTVTAGHSGTEKAGTAVFTDSNSNTFDVELTQSGDGSLFPFAKIIRGTRRIN